ncbi:hypothetical protein KC19_11G079000 [Ceratodon purpureus]|uniref:Uncharacterized protein n=1 Tax=Ceratodon purpureus TaxID=3225 RepID=A0A8T0GCH7_CERPU|nr:hypothetical protein KC19_11G079000 [Ceratodon purpureus]
MLAEQALGVLHAGISQLARRERTTMAFLETVWELNSLMSTVTFSRGLPQRRRTTGVTFIFGVERECLLVGTFVCPFRKEKTKDCVSSGV